MVAMRIVPMTESYAADIATWRYPPPYDCYDVRVPPEFLAEPANGFFAVVAEDETLAGFRSFGTDGRVPGGTYDDSALDTGGGLRPSLTGKGLGRAAISAGLAFGRERFAPPAFRVTVASFNARALRVVSSLGFLRVDGFRATTNGEPYQILVRPERFLTGCNGHAVGAELRCHIVPLGKGHDNGVQN
jgi:ribosomal-protein-alanine N-acetyltransferase